MASEKKSSKRKLDEVDEGFLAFDVTEEKVAEEEVRDGFHVKRSRPKLLNRLVFPWLKVGKRLDTRPPPLIRLHNEILLFCDYIAPTQQEMHAREQAVESIRQVCLSLWPESSLEVFGSQSTKIITPSSDIDLALLNVPVEQDEDVPDLLTKLAERLRSSIELSYLEVIHARVPIIKLDHAATGISVDICINNDQGLRTGAMVKAYLQEFPPLMPLMILLKTFLAQRNLNETYTGGIGSFLLCSMIVSFLQMKLKTAKYTMVEPSWNLGSLLLEFLQFYGVNFNYYATAISLLDGGKYFPKKLWEEMSQDVSTASNRPGILCVQNPDVTDQDMGKSSYHVHKVRRSFEQALQLLTMALQDQHEYSYLGYMIRGDDPLLVARMNKHST